MKWVGRELFFRVSQSGWSRLLDPHVRLIKMTYWLTGSLSHSLTHSLTHWLRALPKSFSAFSGRGSTRSTRRTGFVEGSSGGETLPDSSLTFYHPWILHQKIPGGSGLPMIKRLSSPNLVQTWANAVKIICKMQTFLLLHC